LRSYPGYRNYVPDRRWNLETGYPVSENGQTDCAPHGGFAGDLPDLIAVQASKGNSSHITLYDYCSTDGN